MHSNCMELPCYQELFILKRQRKFSLCNFLIQIHASLIWRRYYLCFVFLEILCHRYSSHVMSWGTVVALPSFGNFDFSSKYIRQCYMIWKCVFYRIALRSAVKIICWLRPSALEDLEVVRNTKIINTRKKCDQKQRK